MFCFSDVTKKDSADVFGIDFVNRHSDKGHEEFLRLDENFRFGMIVFYPEGMQGQERIEHAVHHDAAIIHLVTDYPRRNRSMEAECQSGHRNQNAEDNIAEDKSQNRARRGNNTNRPIPIGASLIIIMLGSTPFNEGFHIPTLYTI